VAAKPKPSRDPNLVGYRADYEGGDKSALASAIDYCAITRKPLPDWVAEAWHDGRAHVLLRLCDWSDVLGKVRRKTPKQIRRETREDKLVGQLVRLLPTIQNPIERGDSEGAFAELARKMGITPRQVREFYYKKYTYGGKQYRVIDPSSSLGLFGRFRQRVPRSKVSRN
jgi:hypothetical protein